jgi:hypothetical protein
MPATDETRSLLKVIYSGLKKNFSTEAVSFDTTVRNPSRILRLYSTINRKGENTADRPWRESFHWPIEQWIQVRPAQIERLAKRFEKVRPVPTPQHVNYSPNHGDGDFSTLDVVRWFTAHGLYEHPLDDNKHAVVCPWEAEHTSSNPNDTIIFEADGGWPGFFCHHSHCEGRNIRDVLVLFGDADAFCSRRFQA